MQYLQELHSGQAAHEHALALLHPESERLDLLVGDHLLQLLAVQLQHDVDMKRNMGIGGKENWVNKLKTDKRNRKDG